MQTEGREAEERPGVWCTAALWEIWRQTKNWPWITESVISVDRGEPQFWHLTAGKKASEIQEENSQDTVYQADWQNLLCSYNTNGLLVRLYTSDLLRFWLCLQNYEEEECVTVHVAAHQSAAALAFKLWIYLTLLKTIYTLTHWHSLNWRYHSWIIEVKSAPTRL